MKYYGRQITTSRGLRNTPVGQSLSIAIINPQTHYSKPAGGLFKQTGGKIVESWGEFDLAGMLMQLGVTPPMGA